MEPYLLCFSGPIEGGKTKLSMRLASKLGLPWVGFGHFLRKVARQLSYPITRESLQNLGQSLVQKDIRQFCVDVLQEVNWKPGMSIVIDGIRHAEVLKTLRDLSAPSRVYLIYLQVGQETQLDRLKKDDLPAEKPLIELEQHSTEVQVLATLPYDADLVITEKPIEQQEEEVLHFLTRANGDEGTRTHLKDPLLKQHSFPDFFQEDDEAALRHQVQWMEGHGAVDNQFLSNFLGLDRSTIVEWRNARLTLPPLKQRELNDFWNLMLLLLDYYNLDHERWKAFLEAVPDSVGGHSGRLAPPWIGGSVKQYLSANGKDGAVKVRDWITSLRFGESI